MALESVISSIVPSGDEMRRWSSWEIILGFSVDPILAKAFVGSSAV